ncbi:hypothetical protein IAU60_001888 [Kwoniella sp. DSM 27419]
MSSGSASGARHQAEYSDSDSDNEGATGGGGKLEKDKLELRREKNRVKQRNLRLRRANHIADLERNLSSLRAENAAQLAAQAQMQQRETSLQGWVHDLESALFRNGLAGEVETLRRIWSEREVIKRPHPRGVPDVRTHGSDVLGRRPSLPVPAQGQGPRIATPVDPLSTLAKAASSVPGSTPGSAGPSMNHDVRRSSYSSMSGLDRHSLSRPGSSRGFDNPYPTPEISWGSQMSDYMAVPEVDKKRKRGSWSDQLGASGSASGSGVGGRPLPHPMSGRMSESAVHTLPPLQAYSAPASASRPLSAPYANQAPPPPLSAQTPAGQAGTPSATSNVSPRSMRISDLISPRASTATEPALASARTSFSGSELPELRGGRESRDDLVGWRADESPDLALGLSNKLPPMRFFDRHPVGSPPMPKDVSPKTRMNGVSLSPKALALANAPDDGAGTPPLVHHKSA